MNLNDIRNLNDNELKRFINDLSQRNNMFCAKCGNIINYEKKYNINVGIYNKDGQKQKKLCCLCTNCYTDLLDYLCIPDVEW